MKNCKKKSQWRNLKKLFTRIYREAMLLILEWWSYCTWSRNRAAQLQLLSEQGIGMIASCFHALCALIFSVKLHSRLRWRKPSAGKEKYPLHQCSWIHYTKEWAKLLDHLHLCCRNFAWKRIFEFFFAEIMIFSKIPILVAKINSILSITTLCNPWLYNPWLNTPIIQFQQTKQQFQQFLPNFRQSFSTKIVQMVYSIALS